MWLFYPRSPCGERPASIASLAIHFSFSIHALLAESDPSRQCGQWRLSNFLSTLSLRRATVAAGIVRWQHSAFLSTLSLRRATTRQKPRLMQDLLFYPRSPCGERPIWIVCIMSMMAFLSTLSLRRATTQDTAPIRQGLFSIHALLAESDSKSAQNSGALLRI